MRKVIGSVMTRQEPVGFYLLWLQQLKLASCVLTCWTLTLHHDKEVVTRQ